MIKCFVHGCNKQLKNNLAVSHHIKMSAINCIKHREYLQELKQKIIDLFETNKNPFETGKLFNTGNCYVQQVWDKAFSKEQIDKRRKRIRKHLGNLRKDASSEIINCKHEEIKKRKNEIRFFCNRQCYGNYKKTHGELYAFNKGKTLEQIVGPERSEEIKQKIRGSHRRKLYIKCTTPGCDFKKRVTANTISNFNISTYLCRKCKIKKRFIEVTDEYECSNCKKTIRRYKKENKKLKQIHTSGIIKFCDKKCYLEYYRSHPERYKKQREYAGFVSIKSFRDKKNFEYAGIKFSSESEKQCAIFLEKEFDVVLKESETCHKIINKIEVDFCFDNVVVEYHQCYSNPEKLSLSERIKKYRLMKFRYEYRTLGEYFKTRKDKLPETYKLFVVENVAQTTLKKLKQQILKEKQHVC